MILPRPPLQGPGPELERLAPLLRLMHGMSADSRRILPRMGFAAYPGEAGDGRRWIADAVARGASAVLWEPDGAGSIDASLTVDGEFLPNLPVPGLKAQISRIASELYGRPSAHLDVIGVTGTNGKTSTTHWLAYCLARAGVPCALVGTLGTGMPDALQATGFTTPGPVELQQQLAELRTAGARAVAMEVSSHGLAQGRVDGVRFSHAVFTNLTRDHLDFHGSMEAYGEAKAALFRAKGLRCAVLNLDDAFGATLFAALQAEGVRCVGTSHAAIGTRPSSSTDIAACHPAAAYQAHAVRFSTSGTRFLLRGPQGELALETRLIGSFNLSNLLGVIACLSEYGVTWADLPALVAQLEAPPGRLQLLGQEGTPQVVVDYAHTPDALEKVLLALRASVQRGRLICVFGCGGDRDPGKRPQMGRIAELHADMTIVTSDNPRSESPEAILQQIAEGMESAPARMLTDRAAAIDAAIELAAPGDLVLIAGKGHETTQEIGGQKLPFSDIDCARAALARWKCAR